MTDFERIEKLYRMGIYRKEHVRAFVKAGVLTAEEYRTLTGEEYPA